jgi:ABC-type polysaccharide/polyol phosphate transport system ATPase subunit
MDPMVVVSNVGKKYRRYHADRPATIQEAMAKGARGWRKMKSVEEFWSLSGISFTVGAGRTVGILGANGSGKSTLLRLIGGVGRPDTGRIDVNGRIGGLLDLTAGFHHDLSGRENAMLAGILNGLSRKEVLERMDDIVSFAEVEDAIDSPIRTYSSGMQMRLAFSVTVHTDPQILLIDEVLAVGDMAFKHKCLERIARFKDEGCSILLVSHVGSTVEDMCDDAVWLDAGRLMAQGPVGDVVEQYASHATANPSRLRVVPRVDPVEEAVVPPAPPPGPPDPVARIGARVFVSSGGMGSTYLANRLRKAGVFSVEKPFVNAFFTAQWPDVLCRRIPERPFVADLNQTPTEAVRTSFQAAQERYANLPRSFELDPTKSLERNMAAYLGFLQEVGASCVLRGTSVEGLLSRWGVRGAVFMIRRPAEGFFSYNQPQRHGDMVDALGGLESPEATAFYAASWNAVAGEYFACLAAGLAPKLIRYESAREDAATYGDPALEAMFDGFQIVSGPAPIPTAVRERLEALVEPYLSRLYP